MKSLLMINTGNGKGKTTAALGLAFRALGHGQRVCIIQFIKGSWKYGELLSSERFKDGLDFHVMGRGFTWKSDNLEKDTAIAVDAWDFARQTIVSGKYDLVILDELTYLISYKMIKEEDVTDCLKNRPENVHVLVTGRNASQGLIDIADMVTQMNDVKHHYKAGIKAQKGIEF
ncbi:Corrinoid adenosyltransferase [Desulfonema limicola]|uniref:corrinoid adenosyltransferase n=1 Tax=Desulfonema limicola TaxID=45656 RepID=A0A975GEQ8_9BACT|nr:cob(I)yrinic acid a,c-diamide adenosyltransferase [Desulfonema limicola]QTA78374.1 Corrinoid adenosyltransferase [Desulfonema limicola]